MRTATIYSLVTVLLALPASAAFSSGSNGSFGPLEVLSGTVTMPLPADGAIHATTVTVASGATLRFTRNGLNTPVFLLATGDVNVGGTIDVNATPGSGGVAGQGGPGGFDGGSAGTGGTPPGDGHGPGGGRGGNNDFGGDPAWGRGAFGCDGPLVARPRDGVVYGNAALLDLVGGSGAGGNDIGFAGSGGGGAILIASDTRITVSGTVMANGGDGTTASGGSGSGGAIRLVAPIVAGNGTLSTLPGSRSSGLAGGEGRMRVDALDRHLMSFLVDPPCSFTAGANMIARPVGLGSLFIVSVAGQAVSPAAASEVVVSLDPGAPATQSVTVEARDHRGTLPIVVVVTPPNGSRVVVEADVPANGGAPVQVEVPVTLPAGSPLTVNAWTR